jgi:hypothetical protein
MKMKTLRPGQLRPGMRFEITRAAQDEGGGWRIRYGFSKFLVAEGSGWSRPLAMKFLQACREGGRGNRPVKR